MSSLIIRSTIRKRARVITATTASETIEAKGHCFYGLVVPSTFDGTTITFKTSDDGTTFQDLYNTSNVQVSMTIAASRSYDLPTELAAWPFWRIECGTSQTGATDFYVVGKG